MSRFFNKDMNIQNCAQAEAESCVKTQVKSVSYQGSADTFELSAFFFIIIGYEIKMMFKRD